MKISYLDEFLELFPKATFLSILLEDGTYQAFIVTENMDQRRYEEVVRKEGWNSRINDYIKTGSMPMVAGKSYAEVVAKMDDYLTKVYHMGNQVYQYDYMLELYERVYDYAVKLTGFKHIIESELKTFKEKVDEVVMT